jgi:S1-C subfamily serine protease
MSAEWISDSRQLWHSPVESKMKRVVVGILMMAAVSLALTAPGAAQERVRGAQPQGWLGVTFNYEREGAGTRTTERAVITEVHPGSPAARAGLQRGDAILQVNGRADVEARVRALRLQPGDTVRVRLRRQGQRDRDVALVAERRPTGIAGLPDAWRDRERVEVRRLPGGERGLVVINGDTVRIPVDSMIAHADSIQRRIRVLIADSLGPRLRMLEREQLPQLREQLHMLDTAFVRAFPQGVAFEVGRRAVSGAEFTELNPELAEYFQGAREGLLVVRVAPESPAARAGLQAGDVVVRANGEAVRTTADLRRTVARAGREEVRLGVVRRGRQTEVRLR